MSAAILFLIVGMWAALIVPMVVRRHDETLEARSVDRFSTAMGVLARRPAGRYVVVPRRPAGADAPVLSPPPGRAARTPGDGRAAGAVASLAGGAADGAAAAGRAGLDGVAGLRRALRHRVHAWQDRRDERLGSRVPLTSVQRRRRTFGALVALALVTLGLGLSPAGGRGAWTLHALADLALLGCVVVLRVQVVRAAQAAWLAETQGDGWGEGEHWTSGWADEEAWAEDSWTDQAWAGEAGADDTWADGTGAAEDADAAPAAEPVVEPVVAEEDLQAAVPLAAGSPWQPVPVPVPTYVTAPAAPRRVLDLDATPRPVRAVADDDGTLLDDILDGRRAVGS